MDKSNQHKVKLWMPITKDSSTGKYHAVLSDDSLDRDEEIVGKELIDDWGANNALPALANHENSMEKWVGGWENIKAIQKGYNNALIAEPWFFSKEANPLAARIKLQVDEAIKKNLNPGISIGAIVYDSRMEKRGDKEIRVFTKGELLEATWVPIQSNRNANYGHVAKKFNLNKEGITMEKQFTQKDVDVALEKQSSEMKVDFEKQMKTKDAEVADLNKKLEDSNKEVAEAKKSFEEASAKLVESDKEKTAAKAEAEKANKTALEKQKIADENSEGKLGKMSESDKEKAFAAGKIPLTGGE